MRPLNQLNNPFVPIHNDANDKRNFASTISCSSSINTFCPALRSFTSFDTLLTSSKALAELGNIARDLAICQLVGPLAFARMTGLRTITREDCTTPSDDFLATHRRAATPADEREVV